MSARPFLIVLLFATTACATTGATFKSGVGDTFLAASPWYAGARVSPVAAPGTRVGILPVLYQPGATQPASFDPPGGAGSAIAELLGEMNAYLDSLTTAGGTAPIRLVDDARAGASTPASLGVPPDVRFGCITELDLPDGDCAEREGALGRGQDRMKLAVGRPSTQWITRTAGAMQAANVSHALVLTLELGQYLPRQTGLRGDKSVQLGTRHTASLPWLTSLETPIQVLQLTGVLVDQNGLAVRIGAEGLLAKRTRLLVSAIGAQELITPEDLSALRSRRRDELPGTPLVWKEALRQLVVGLTGPLPTAGR